jgi:phosphoribosylformylglycinamidine cyclo-ligase
VIVVATGTGLHGNGWTAARDLAAELPQKYRTPIPGTAGDFGSWLIQPTPIYSAMVEDIQERGVSIHYAVNMTGHGWLKLMRAPEPFVYVIERLPPPQPVFTFFQSKTGWPIEKMYRTFNMNAGFAFYVHKRSVPKVIDVIEEHGLNGVVIGHIEKRGNKKAIAGEIEFDGSELNIR